MFSLSPTAIDTLIKSGNPYPKNHKNQELKKAKNLIVDIINETQFVGLPFVYRIHINLKHHTDHHLYVCIVSISFGYKNAEEKCIVDYCKRQL